MLICSELRFQQIYSKGKLPLQHQELVHGIAFFQFEDIIIGVLDQGLAIEVGAIPVVLIRFKIPNFLSPTAENEEFVLRIGFESFKKEDIVDVIVIRRKAIWEAQQADADRHTVTGGRAWGIGDLPYHGPSARLRDINGSICCLWIADCQAIRVANPKALAGTGVGTIQNQRPCCS